MKIGIVTKLFLLTTLLCMLTLSIMFIGQTLFFKQYYANQKINDIEEGIRSFKKAYLKAGEDVSIIQKLEQDFYRENNTWITSLDNKGNIKYANDFSVIIHLDDSPNKDFSNRDITIPLYSLISLEDIERGKFDLEQGNRVMIDGIKKDNTIVPAILTIEDKNAAFENKMLMDKLEKDNAFVPATLVEKKDAVLENKQLSEKLFGKKAEEEQTPKPKKSSEFFFSGEIKKLQLPERTTGSNIYTNRVFIERIKQFQANLILNENHNSDAKTMDYEENNIKYKILISPIKDAAGETTYIFSMTSFQPVDEAVQMLQSYYIYLIIFVLFLIVLVSFYYSKKIAKPLLQINDTTNKIANLDFSEIIPIRSKDEIGTLSHNINTHYHVIV